ncbi:MAG: single-stranded-DNA-specific exonuclease RecJ [Candidatus Competibacterales bacterium]
MTVHIRRYERVEPLPPLPVPPVLQRVYAHRQIRDPRELAWGLECLLSPLDLKGMDAAAEQLAAAVVSQQPVVIVADYDADGATSCALVWRALVAMGHGSVDYLVPSRFAQGYGLSAELVALAAAKGGQLLLTVDNGIASLEGVAAAKAAGMTVVVSDHHLPGSELPLADAIVNPNQPECTFASKHLAGVGVAFYLMLAVRARLRDRGWFKARPEPNLAQWLDLVALGTVADVVALDHNNRILVAQGLRRIRAGRCVPGLGALIQAAGRPQAQLTAADLGYFIGPRLNAAGRMDDMSIGVECLICDDPRAAQALAARLEQFNRARRAKEAQMQAEANKVLEDLDLSGAMPAGLCLYDDTWHEGLIGLVASRIKDRAHRPVVAFAPDKDGLAKGSARSVAGLHIRDAIDAVAVRHPGMVAKYGGHAMAAGLTLARRQLEPFRRAFDAEVRRHLSDDDFCRVLWSDGPLAPEELTLDIAQALRAAGPWGQGFPEPLFDGEFRVLRQQVLKDKHLKLTLSHPGGEGALDAIAFNHTDCPGERIHIAYRLDVNAFRGAVQLQLVVQHLEAVG